MADEAKVTAMRIKGDEELKGLDERFVDPPPSQRPLLTLLQQVMTSDTPTIYFKKL